MRPPRPLLKQAREGRTGKRGTASGESPLEEEGDPETSRARKPFLCFTSRLPMPSKADGRMQVAQRDHLVHHISDKGPSSLYPEPSREGKLQRDCRGSAHLAWTSFLLLWSKRDSPLQRLVLALQPFLPWQPPGLSRCSTSPLEGVTSAPAVSAPTLPPLPSGACRWVQFRYPMTLRPWQAPSCTCVDKAGMQVSLCGWGRDKLSERSRPLRLGSPGRYPQPCLGPPVERPLDLGSPAEGGPYPLLQAGGRDWPQGQYG